MSHSRRDYPSVADRTPTTGCAADDSERRPDGHPRSRTAFRAGTSSAALSDTREGRRARSRADPGNGKPRPDGRRFAGEFRRSRRPRGHRRHHRRGTRLWRFQHQRGSRRGLAARGGHHEQRDARACRVLDSAHGLRRNPDGGLRHRAQRRFGRERAQTALPPRRRPLHSRRREDLDNLRRLRRRLHRVRPHRARRRAAPRE